MPPLYLVVDLAAAVGLKMHVPDFLRHRLFTAEPVTHSNPCIRADGHAVTTAGAGFRPPAHAFPPVYIPLECPWVLGVRGCWCGLIRAFQIRADGPGRAFLSANAAVGRVIAVNMVVAVANANGRSRVTPDLTMASCCVLPSAEYTFTADGSKSKLQITSIS